LAKNVAWYFTSVLTGRSLSLSEVYQDLGTILNKEF